MIELLQLKTRSERRRFAQRVVNQGIRADALRQLIREHQGHRSSRRPGSGRPRRPPLGAWHAIDTAQKELATLLATLQWLAESPNGPRTGPKRHSLKRIQRQLRLLGDALKELQVDLS